MQSDVSSRRRRSNGGGAICSLLWPSYADFIVTPENRTNNPETESGEKSLESGVESFGDRFESLKQWWNDFKHFMCMCVIIYFNARSNHGHRAVFIYIFSHIFHTLLAVIFAIAFPTS